MKEFVCLDCGGVIYSPDKNLKDCPYCSERVIVFDDNFSSMIISSPEALSFLKSLNNISKARIIFNRRKLERRKKNIEIDNNSRVSDRRMNDSMAIGWMFENKKNKS